MPFIQKLHAACFNLVHGHNLIYNASWEDPRLDRAALNLGPDDTLLTITSGGCNVLDYALMGPRQVYAVDTNPRQNALLELKLAGLKRLDHSTFFALFGRGRLSDAREVYHDVLRLLLSSSARAYWDRHIDFFIGSGWRRSFYFRGTAGTFARLINVYIDSISQTRDEIMAVLNASSVDEQRDIYDRRLRHVFWKPLLRWAVRRDATLSLLGVPAPQRRQVDADFPGGIGAFIENSIETVFTRLPLADNYFWRVYLTGEYTPECCPEYLKKENFLKLQQGLADRVTVATTSVLGFLQRHEAPVSRFVLLDHMDWLSADGHDILRDEWQAILNRAAPDTRVLWRSGGLRTEFVDALPVTTSHRSGRLGDMLNYRRELADSLHALDRVHTYGSFHIADLAA